MNRIGRACLESLESRLLRANTLDLTQSANSPPIDNAPVFTSTVPEINHWPTATSESAWTYNITTTDSDGDPLAISAQTLPAWLTLTDHGDGTATLGGTPTNADGGTGSNSVVLQVSDGSLSTTQSFAINVLAIDHPSEFTSTAPTTGTIGQKYTYNITAHDPDRTDLMIQVLTILPPWLKLTDHGDSTATLTGTPGAGQVGDFTIKLVCYDGTDTPPTQQFTIHISAAPVTNHAPAFSSSPITTASSVAAYTYNITTSDVDGDSRTISTVTVLPAWLTFVDHGNGTASLSGSPTAFDKGDVAITLRVSDGKTTTDQSFTLAVSVPDVWLTPQGIAIITGDADDNRLHVWIVTSATDQSFRIERDGVVTDYALSSVHALEVYGLDGNDDIQLDTGTIPTYALGGAGNDTLTGGDEYDNFVGGGGKDQLNGGRGDDRLSGGNANDTLAGNDGDDRLYGGDGNDILVGGNGKDRCYGEAGDDFFSSRGDKKIDNLYGGGGDDRATYDALLDHLTDVLPA